jgi:hypothetical protein
MRRVRKFRGLGEKEKQTAKSVFKNTIPYERVLVSDGLGAYDRPFTMPTDMPSTALFNVDEKHGDYVLHVGEGYYGLATREEDKALLVHELTHVWQGEHSGSNWDYVFGSAWSQALADDAYKYYKGKEYDNSQDRLKAWGDYNPEEQAQIVEDWFAAGMKTGGPDVDRRFYFIKAHIRREKMDSNWIQDQWVVKPLDEGKLNAKPWYPGDVDSYLTPILQKRFSASDTKGQGDRVAQLMEIFSRYDAQEARDLLARLEARRTGDRVAQYFHEHLSTATRDRLKATLRGAK